MVPAPLRGVGRFLARRWRWVVLVGIPLLVASTALGYIVRYQPLKANAGVAAVRARDVANERIGQRRALYRVSYLPGRGFGFGFTLRNLGRWGVTITGIAEDRRDLGLARLTEILISRPSVSCCSIEPEDLRPFERFSLPAGTNRTVLVRAAFSGCEDFAPGAHAVFDDVEVSYRVLGLPRHARVALPYTVSVDSPADEACPDRAGDA